MSRTFNHVVAGIFLSAPFFVFLGHIASVPDLPTPLVIDFDSPVSRQPVCVCQPATCPAVECPMWPLHKQVLAAKTKTAEMDAYLAGAESIWWATESCERATTAPCCSQAVDQMWDVEYDLSMLNLRVHMESVENNNWWKACRELLRVWPTEPTVEGNYPDDFPKYCW